MKEVTIKSKIVGRGGASAATSPGKGVSVDMSGYLLKKIWDKAFEIRVTETGEEYLFGKLNFATQYGITMYANGGLLDLPSIFEGIPFDNKTIWLNPETKLVEVIGSTGEGEGDSADFSNVRESGEGNAFTSFMLSEDGKEITFVKGETFAKQSDYEALNTKVTDFLEGSDADDIINKWKELEAFLSGMKESNDLATILATKWTTDDAKIENWDAAYKWGNHAEAGYMKKSVIYDESLKCWKLDGDLLVTGGITMYANEGKYTPSTITDAVNIDNDTLVRVNGVIMLNPDIEFGGGVADSVAWSDITDIPTWIGNSKPSYTTSEVTEGTNLYFTNARAVSALSDTLKGYVTLSGTQTISGEKNFTGGLKVNGSPIVYNATGKYWKLEGDLLVTGGITMFGSDSSFSPSTITQAVNVDGTTIINDGKKLMLNPDIQLGGGGVTDYNDLTGRPDLSVYALKTSLSSYQTKITSTNKLDYGLISGTPTIPTNTNQLTNGAGFITSSGSITGNAATATKLQTARTLWGKSFDGSANVSGDIALSTYKIFWQGDASNYYISCPADTGGAGLMYKAYSSHRFVSGGSERLTILSSGNVGVGVSSPTSKLHVDGTSTFDGTILARDINPQIAGTYSIGAYGSHYKWVNANCFSSGAVGNGLWLCGGTNNGTGVVIARSGSNTATGELCRFTEQGMVWASGVIPAIVSTAQEMHLKYNNADATSIVFNGTSFKPFINASNNLMLGRYDSLWKGLFLSTDASVPRTEKGVTFCSSNGYAEGKIGANSSGIGIYTVGGLYLRGGCTKNANGTMTESSTGAVIDASGNMLVTGGVTMYSDLRKKTILNHVELSLKEVADAPLIEHYYNSDESKRTHVGSVAQYWAGMNDWFCKEDEEGFLTMEIQNAALASAISVARELTRYESKTDKQIKKLKKRIGELEEEIENLKKM